MSANLPLIDQPATPRFVVLQSLANSPGHKKYGGRGGDYYRIAVVETFGTGRPGRISMRDRCTRRIVSLVDGIWVGATAKSAGYRAVKDAFSLAEKMNRQAQESRGRPSVP